MSITLVMSYLMTACMQGVTAHLTQRLRMPRAMTLFHSPLCSVSISHLFPQLEHHDVSRALGFRRTSRGPRTTKGSMPLSGRVGSLRSSSLPILSCHPTICSALVMLEELSAVYVCLQYLNEPHALHIHRNHLRGGKSPHSFPAV